MSKFRRERRYMVLKISDIQQYLPQPLISHLESIADEVNGGRQMDGRPPLECVVVESDWPEYEPTWAAIKARVDGATMTEQKDKMREDFEKWDFQQRVDNPIMRDAAILAHDWAVWQAATAKSYERTAELEQQLLAQSGQTCFVPPEFQSELEATKKQILAEQIASEKLREALEGWTDASMPIDIAIMKRDEALAIQPDHSLLREFEAGVLEKAAEEFSICDETDTAAVLCRMAQEIRERK